MQANSANFSERSTITDWLCIICWKILLKNHLIEYPMQAGIWSTNPPLKIKTWINIQDSISHPYLLLKSHLSLIQDIYYSFIGWNSVREKITFIKRKQSDSERPQTGRGRKNSWYSVGRKIYLPILLNTKRYFDKNDIDNYTKYTVLDSSKGS